MFATKRDSGDSSAASRRGSLDAGIVREFESALAQNEVVVHYQPVLDLRSGAVRGVEALVRRHHPQRGLLAPAEFVPHVERTPLIRALTLHVVAEALGDARTLEPRRSARSASRSTSRTARSTTPSSPTASSASSRRPVSSPELLTLEVVPSGPGAGAELDRTVLERLTQTGIRLSLDDFGRASSLAALRVLPLAEVKIDAGFVRGLGRGGADDAIVRSLLRLAHDLGLETVAEGVETRAAWDALAAMGCDRAQGFYVQPALPADELAEWLDAQLAGRRARRVTRGRPASALYSTTPAAPRSPTTAHGGSDPQQTEEQRRRRRRRRRRAPTCGAPDPTAQRPAARRPRRRSRRPQPARRPAPARPTRAAAPRRGAGTTAGRSRRARSRHRRPRSATAPRSRRGRPRT